MTRVMGKRLFIVVIAAVLLLGALVGFNLFKQSFVAKLRLKNAAPPQTVSALRASFAQWQPEITTIGSLRAARGVDVTTEVAGLVRRINFKSGDEVAAGAVLVQLNADSDVAQQMALQAAADLSQTVYNRDKVQFEDQAISKAQLDGDAADLKNKRAQVASQAALVAKKTIRAPFAGRLGITTVNPGQYLNTGDKIVTLQELDPVYVDFSLPQQQLSRVSLGQTVTLTTDAFPAVSFAGTVNAVDPRVDPSTRNFQGEATIANADHRLLPGMFGRVAVASGTAERYLTIPQTAVTYNPYGTTIFVAKSADAVKAEAAAAAKADEGGQNESTGATAGEAKASGGSSGGLVAQQVFIVTGPTRGDQVAVVKGLNEGDLVVTSGQLKLLNGTPLTINNAVQPRNDANPAPQEQ